MSELRDIIERKISKIRILEEILKNAKLTLIAPGDPDLPDGLEFDYPEAWKKKIKKAIRELKKSLKQSVDDFTSVE